MDFYLNEGNVVNRLVTEWNSYGSIVIAYDFDNTVYDYHNEGHKYPMVIDLLRECKKFGAYLMVYTAKVDSELGAVRDYLTENDIPFDSINETPSFIPFPDEKKLYYNHLLDDRAGLPSAYTSLLRTITTIKEQRGEK
jgi:hypothetical protein